MSRIIRPVRALLAPLLALALFAPGCGGDGSTSTMTETESAAGTPAADDSPDEASNGDTIEVVAVDYAFEGVPATVAAGTSFTMTNASDAELHEVVALRLPDGEERSLEELLEIEPGSADAVEPEFIGVMLAPPGEDGTLEDGSDVLSEPGRYAFVCFIPVGADPDALMEGSESEDAGPPHFTKGMVAEIIVE